MAEKDKKLYDEAVELGLVMEKSEKEEIVTDEELKAMGYSLPPDDMLDRIKKALAEDKNTKIAEQPVKPKKKFRKKYIFLIAILTILTVGAFSVRGVRNYMFDVVSQFNGSSVEFRGRNINRYVPEPNETAAYENMEKFLGVSLLKPYYLPEGFVFDKNKIFEDGYVKLFYKNGNNQIRLTQTLSRKEMIPSDSVDTKEDILYFIDAHNSQIEVRTYLQEGTGVTWYTAVWDNEKMIYKVDTNCSKEELELFIKNLK